MKPLFLTLLITINALSCEKEILVLEVFTKSLPSILNLKKNSYTGKKIKIKIKCELFNEISDGDTLVFKDPYVEFNIRGSLFNGPIEEKSYKVLKKDLSFFD